MNRYSAWRMAAAVILGMMVSSAAWADLLEGRVAAVNERALSLVVYDANGRPYPNALNLRVGRDTQVSGASKITALRPNDAVGVVVHQEESRVWVADRVTLYREVNARPATKNPPPSLRDILGNPVAKGAITGAASGALASGLSGGKAGKGALIGAGVGAATGLLEGLFGGGQSSSRQTQSNDSYNQ